MARLQQHHISYEPEWQVELTMQMHRCISRIQITKATTEQYARLTNYIHSLTDEWNRMRKELDIGGDYRVTKPKGRTKTRKMVRREGRKIASRFNSERILIS